MYTTIRVFALVTALLLSACGEYSAPLPNTTNSTPPPPPPNQDTCLQEFQTVVFPILDKQERCQDCHTPPNSVANPFHMLANDAAAFTLFSQTAMKKGANDMSLVLLKPLGQENHGGGDVFPTLGASDPEYIAIQTLVDKIVSPGGCP